jgi:hypothetical protein
MCPPAATSASFRELRPIVPSSVWWVVSSCELPTAVVSGTRLVVVDGASCLNGGCGLWFGEGTRQRQWQWQRWWRGWLRGEGAFSSLSGLAGQHALAMTETTIVFGHVGVIDGAVVPVMGVPQWEDTVGVVAVDVRSRAPATPMSHSQAVETKPLRCGVCTHHVAWTTPVTET